MAALLLVACRHSAGGGGGERSLTGPVREGKSLLESGQLDAALAELQKAPDDPDSLYYQGRVFWANESREPRMRSPARQTCMQLIFAHTFDRNASSTTHNGSRRTSAQNFGP